jgi:hypothetical protein
MRSILVPVIAVFTKYEQFKFNIRMKLEDEDRHDSETGAKESERIFQEHYLKVLGANPPFVRLESKVREGSSVFIADGSSAGMHEAGKRCTELLEVTARALDDGVVAVMLLAVQTGNLELGINSGVRRWVFQ